MVSRQQNLFIELLQSRRAGVQLTRKNILAHTGWKRSTFDTHISKNKLTPWLEKVDGDTYLTRINGPDIVAADILLATKQVTAVSGTYERDDVLCGASHEEYVLRHELGRGATAHVWSAIALKAKRDVAIKICEPRPDLLDPTHLSNVQRRFRREARNGERFDHECVIKIYDHGEHSGQPFTVLELASTSLEEQLKSTGVLASDDSIPIIHRALHGLAYIHNHGCIHRDIKPANILKADRGFILADLGIVQWDDMNPAFVSAGTITSASVQLGSWYYMSPEQRADPHKITPASDVYSLGVSWYQMLTSLTPDPTAFVAKAYTPPSCNSILNDAVGRMTSFEPEDRPTIEELVEVTKP